MRDTKLTSYARTHKRCVLIDLADKEDDKLLLKSKGPDGDKPLIEKQTHNLGCAQPGKPIGPTSFFRL